MSYTRGFFVIGIYHVKSGVNVGTLWRSAYQLGASGVFTIGRRYSRQASDTCNATAHMPLRHFLSMSDMLKNRPKGARIVAVEMEGTPLSYFSHPEQAIYLLGAEDHGLPEKILQRCDHIVSLNSIRTPSFNVAVAGSVVMYHRVFGTWCPANNIRED